MPFKSRIPDLTIPKCSILDFLFPPGSTPSDKPLWINSRDQSISNSPRTALLYARRFGFGLQKLGVNSGDVCLLFTPNHIFVPVAYWGVVGLGAAFSGANPNFTVKELEYQIAILQPRLVLIHPSLLETGKKAAKNAGLSEDQLYLFADREVPSVGAVRDWRTILGTPEEGRNWQWKKLSPEKAQTHVAAINFSSGTTGLPKGVMVSHYNIIANVMQIKSLYDFSPTEHWAGFLPLYHAYGQCYGILMTTILQIPMQVMSAFNFEEYLRIIQTHKVTRMQTVPPIMIMLSKRPETANYDLSSVKEMLCGAAPLKSELQASVAEKFNVRITQGWGMTETTCAATGVPWWEEQRSDSVGIIMPNTEVKLLDDKGKEAGIGERGEIFVRGPQIALGYWRNPEATKKSFDSDGWLKSGDVAVIKAGFMWIVDRKKELIKVQALQVSPAEIEATLLEHPDVSDAGVVGIILQGEEWPRAYISLNEEARGKVRESQIQRWIEERVSKHKRLVGGVEFIPEVPRLASGKIQRKEMKEWARRDAARLEGKIAKL